MNKEIQEQLDAQIASKRAAQVVEVSEAPTFTPDIFEHDDRETSRVEVNFSDMSARWVESSDAPKVTRAVLETLGKPVKTVEIFFENSFWQVAVRDGIPLELEIKQLKMLLESADREGTPAAREERDLEISRMLLAGMMEDPPFSYKGEAHGTPIEDRSPVMIASLAEALSAVISPEEDQIFQVTVRRGTPADAFAVTGESFEWYPAGGKQKKWTDMSDEELSTELARHTARRKVLVPAMIVDPKLSYTDEGDGYCVDALSERFMKTFNEAHRVVNVPAAGLAALQRFRRANRVRSEGADEGSEPVGDDRG